MAYKDPADMSNDEIASELAKLEGASSGSQSMSAPASPSEMSDEEIVEELARLDGDSGVSSYDPRSVARATNLVTPEEASSMPSIGGAELAALRSQGESGIVANPGDGSVGNWLGNFWNAVAHNSSGKLTERNIDLNLQDILRGTVRKDGKEVPLTQLDDSELDYLVDGAGWNGPGAYFRRFLGKWARSDNGFMQEWDRTTGANIADPVARKAARVKHAQDMAREIVGQNESVKAAGRIESENRPRDFGANVVAGGIQTGAYMLPYMIPGTHGVVAGLIEGGDRAQELLSDRYETDENGNVRVAAERDSLGSALAKGAARGVLAPLIEAVGGELAAGAIGGIAKGTLGRIPLVKNIGGKFVESAAGKAVNGWIKSMHRFGKYTGLQSFPVEALEELEDQVVDSALALNMRNSETEGTVGSRAKDSLSQFMKPESLLDLAESMLLVQVLGGGVAALNDRTRSKAIDNILARDAGVEPERLKGYSVDEKWAAWEAYANGLSEEEVAKKFEAGEKAVKELTKIIGEDAAALQDFKAAADAMYEGPVNKAPGTDDEATRAERIQKRQEDVEAALADAGEEMAVGRERAADERSAQEVAEGEESRRRRELAERKPVIEGSPAPEQPATEAEATVQKKARTSAERSDAATPTTGETDEARNGADEAPMRPEQGAVQQPQEGEVGKAETPEPPRGEAPAAGVVEPPTPAEATQKPAEAAAESKMGEDTPATAEGTEAPSRASDATPAVVVPDKASDAQKTAFAKLGEGKGVAVTSAKMGKGGVLRVKYTMPSADGKVVEFDSTIDAEGKTSTSAAGVKAAPAPAPATQAQTNIPNDENSAAFAQTSEPPKSDIKKLGRPKKSDEQRASDVVEKRLRPILDFVRNEDGSFNPDALRNHDGNNGLPLKDLKLLNEHPEIIDDLGLPAEDAAALKSALTEAYNTQRVATPNSKEGKVSEAGQFNYSVSASKALERLAKHPNNPKVFAIAQQQVLAALEAAKRQTDENGRKNEQSISFWQARLDELNTKFDSLPKETQGAILRQAQSLQGNLQAAERKGRKSNTTAEGEELDIADEGRDMGEDNVMSDEQANAEYGDEARFARAAASEDDTPGAPSPKGSMGRGGSLGGNRHLIVDSVNGDELSVTMKDAAGKVLVKGQKMTRAQWSTLANGAVAMDGNPAAPQKGDLIRMSKSTASDLPDAWTPETQKPLERVANALRNVVTSGGKRIKVEFLNERPESDDPNAFKNPKGETVGEYDAAKGEIRLYPGATVADVVHEFTHPLVDFARREAAAGRGEFLNKIKEIIDAERATWEQPVRDAYKGKGEEEILEEIFTHAMGEKGAKLFGKSTNTLQGRQWYKQLWEKIKGLWQDFATKMGWNKADLRGLERMSPENAAQKILSEMAKGRSFGDATTGGEGTRNALMPATMEKIYSAIKQYKDAGIKFSDFTESIISMLQRGGRKTISLPGFNPTPLIIESPATTQGVQRRLDLDHSAFNHNWENGNAYTGYYTWPEFDRAFQASNLKNIQKLPNKHNGQELWQWTVEYPKTDAHEAYELTWRIARDEKTGKMANLFTTREQTDYPPRQMKTPEGAHFDTITFKDVADASSSGDSVRSISQPSAESQVGAKVTPAEDAAYMDAVKRGDMETAQRMVDEAAEQSGYGRIGFHGTKYKHGRFTEFAKGSHIGSEIYQALSRIGVDVDSPMSKEHIERIVEDLKANGGDVLSLRVALKNPLRISDFGESWHGLEFVRKLHVEHPDLFSSTEWDRLAKNPTLAHEMIEAKGYDGLVYDNTSEGILDYSGDTPGRYDAKGEYVPNDAYIPFHASQIKLADPVTYDNNGDVVPLSKRFNPTSNDIRESRRVVRPGNPAKPTTDLIDKKRTKGERLREGAQDADIAIRNVQDELGGIVDKQTASGHTDAKTTFKKDGTVDKLGSTDVYSAKMRANGHLQAGFNEIEAGQRRIDKTLADNGITPEEFGKFLYAQHAPERNQTIAERKAEDADKATWRKAREEAAKGNTAPLDALRKAVVVDPANKEYSGMSTDEAKAYLASPAVAAKRAALESAANELYKMERQNLDRLLESGRISKDFHDLLTTRWQKYVPLRTDMEGKDGAAYNLSVGGFRQNEFMTAEGRKTLADSPYAFAMLQVQQGLRGAEANTINLTAANLVRHAESLGHHIGDIMQGKEAGRGKGWTFNFGDGDIVQVGGDMKLAKNRNDIILFKEDGELKAIRMVKGKEGRGEALADAITGHNVRQWHKDLTILPRATRWLSAMRTQYSPEFMFSNALADHMESTQALIGRYGIKDGFKLAGKALAWEKRNRKDLRRYIKTGDPGTGYVKEAIDAGILIKGGVAAQGYSGELKNIESSYEKFVRDAKGFGKMTAKEKASFVWDGLENFISNTNELIENSTRIGIYSALRESGVSKADAVKFAREATVDFNRKGTYTPWLNGLYMFSNASVQGALRSVQALGDAKGHELIGLLVAAGVAKAVLDSWLGDDDEREKAGGRNARNLSEYDKKHKLGIPIGNSKQFTGIRMRGPYAAIPYLAQTFANVALGETSAADAAKTVLRELTDQATDLVSGNGMVNDKGEFDGALLGQTFAPTLADPLVQLYSGKDYKGDERKAKVFDKTMPLSSNGKRSTSGWYKGAAEGLNWLTGGNENRKGLVDVAPEDLQLVVEFFAGGVGRDLHNAIATGKNIAQAASGGTPERTLSQMPFLRTLVNEYPENTSRYYAALDDYEADKAEYKKTTDPERRRELRDGKPYLLAGKTLLDGQIDRVKELMHLERGEIKVGQKWVAPKIERTEVQKEKYRKQRLMLQAQILKRLGK